MIDASVFSVIPAGAALINTASAELIGGEALFDAVNSNRLGRVWMTPEPAEIQAWAANHGHEHSALKWMREGRLNSIDLASARAPNAESRAIDRALEIANAYMKGRAPKHLLIDPALPRRLTTV